MTRIQNALQPQSHLVGVALRNHRTVMPMDLESAKHRQEVMLKSGWLPGRKYCELVRVRTGGMIETPGERDAHADSPDKEIVNVALAKWVMGEASDEQTLASMVDPIGRCHRDQTCSDDMSKDERLSTERAMWVWKKVIAESAKELHSKFHSQMRLRILREYGYPCGKTFGDVLNQRINADWKFTPDDDTLAEQHDKKKVDETLAKWVAGEINDDIALTQLSSFVLHYAFGGRGAAKIKHGMELDYASRTLGNVIRDGWQAVLLQASPEVKETYDREWTSVSHERLENEVAEKFKNRYDNGKNDGESGRSM